jgi:hypothetical protein
MPRVPFTTEFVMFLNLNQHRPKAVDVIRLPKGGKNRPQMKKQAAAGYNDFHKNITNVTICLKS